MWMMKNQWNNLGHPMLEYDNDRARKAFELQLRFKAQQSSEKVAPQVAPQVTPQVTPQVARVVSVIDTEMTRMEIMVALELKDRMHFAGEYLQPALDAGLVEMTIPDKPRSSKQRYRLTELGRTLTKKQRV
ncbi:MAG: hypothetical protein QNJ97_14780 [Myxococcota bacterium]|nr:hypothetical protein [Myxococcota bacterium]